MRNNESSVAVVHYDFVSISGNMHEFWCNVAADPW
jgi:hypothetical protein